MAAGFEIAARHLDLARHILIELGDVALQPLDERHEVGSLAPLLVERPFLQAEELVEAVHESATSSSAAAGAGVSSTMPRMAARCA